METIIKLDPSELNIGLLEKIKSFISDKKNIDVTISLKEFDADYAVSLSNSIEQAEETTNLITFTMEDFLKYSA